MSHAVSFAEIDSQHVELLPARTVMSAAFLRGGGGDGGIGGTGGPAQGGLGANILPINVVGSQPNVVGSGIGGSGGDASGGVYY